MQTYAKMNSISNLQSESPINVDIEPVETTLKVRLAGRPDASVAPGGGEIQMQATAHAMSSIGVSTEVSDSGNDSLCGVDCLHLFGSLPSHLPLALAAKAQNIPVVLSTVAWFELASYWQSQESRRGRLSACSKFLIRSAFPRFPSWRRRLYHTVDRLIPNSNAEAQQLVRYFEVRPDRISVVPNGANRRFGQVNPESFVQSYGLHGFVLSAGRIEPRKNQLGLIRALQETDVPIVILGDVVPGHEAYEAACRREGGPNVTFIGRVDHFDPLLESAYAACGCLALTSWFETPGLAALEAGMSGVPLILPDCGSTREYFGEDAQYVRPNNLCGIRRAVSTALLQRRNSRLATRIGQAFSWEKVARITKGVYEEVLNFRGTVNT